MLDVTRAEIEREVKRALPDCGDLTTCHPLIKGHGHQSFVLETNSKANLLLKIALRTDQLGKMKSLRHVLGLAADHHIPAPKTALLLRRDVVVLCWTSLVGSRVSAGAGRRGRYRRDV